MSRNQSDKRADCIGCAIPPTRREFIRDLSLAVAGALSALGVTREAAAELAFGLAEPVGEGTLATTYPIPAGDSVQIDRKNEIILVRWEHAVYAFNLSCPHQNTALKWNEKDGKFKCPKHNSRYQPNGVFIDGRATRGMDRFAVSLQGANVVVDVNAMHKQDADPTGWAAALVKLPPG